MTATTTATSTASEAHVRSPSTPGSAPAHAVEPEPHPAPAAAPQVAAAPGRGDPSAPAHSAPGRGDPSAPAHSAPVAADTSAPAHSAPVEITCREERLDITTEWHVLGTAKLRKYVTSERVERRVPVVRERVRVERMPVSEAERASLTEREVAEAVEEVTLREERPVVRKYLAPIERVRLVVERYTEEEVIRDELRRENVEIHDTTAAAVAAPTPTNGSTPPASDGTRPAALRPLV
ncbi:YsnF/AvaK domain-containing protein [Kitasatospora sp. NPDC059648]|uniref:YsnF/AvaK domain-containing protein n=1 Tax=Kitasatospora sp. NPDC059648 TaxID=3346894 RepID=UPI00368C5BEC